MIDAVSTQKIKGNHNILHAMETRQKISAALKENGRNKTECPEDCLDQTHKIDAERCALFSVSRPLITRWKKKNHVRRACSGKRKKND
jgi:hypothetical protein